MDAEISKELVVADILKEQWYEALIDDCKSIITEAVFTSRWALVEGYWLLGQRIHTDVNFKEYAKGNKASVQGLARNLALSERTLYYALEFAQKYPSLDSVPEGKNISWNKIITKYLPAPKENKLEIPLPEGKYGVIVIDPPWPYGTEYDIAKTRRVASPYPELSIKELESFILPSADNCVLWLWTTHRFIWEAKRLMEVWGFEYKIILTWNKVRLGMGEWLRCQTEFCLLGIKGKPTWNLTNQRDIITAARGKHSEKPDAFYELVRQICTGKKLDIFVRREREGFDGYGNELS